MIRINQMKLNIEHTSDDFERKILKTLWIPFTRNMKSFQGNVINFFTNMIMKMIQKKQAL